MDLIQLVLILTKVTSIGLVLGILGLVVALVLDLKKKRLYWLKRALLFLGVVIILLIIQIKLTYTITSDILNSNQLLSQDPEVSTWPTFTSEKLRYSFKYPSEYIVKEDDSGALILKDSSKPYEFIGHITYSGIDTYVFKKGSTTETELISPNASFKEFAALTLLPGCTADAILYCDKVISQEDFKSDNGAVGYKIYLNLVSKNIKGEVIKQEAWGPVYIFDIAAKNSTLRSLQLEPELGAHVSQEDQLLLEKIARTMDVTQIVK